jgi:hypothetical protein
VFSHGHLERGGGAQHRPEQGDVIAHRLLRELSVVDFLVDVRVHVFNADVANPHRAEGLTEVPPDDALVVLLAALPRRALVEPVVAEVPEGLLGRRRIPDVAPDLLDLSLVAPPFGLGALVIVVDGALPPPPLVEPADAPFVAVLGGLGYDRVLAPSKVAGLLQCRRGWPQQECSARRSKGAWPKSGPETKNAKSAYLANLASPLQLRG